MLDNVITLPVDTLNNGNPADQNFERTREFGLRTIYQGPNHTSINQDTLTFYITEPKRSGNSLGVIKAGLTFRTDTSVLGADSTTTNAVTRISAVSFNVPVGTTAAERKADRQRVIAILDNDELMEDLCEKLQV